MNTQFKIWPVLRDVIIVTVLSGLGGFIVGFASTSGHNSPLYIYSLAISNSLFITIGFTISGCLALENRWRHLAFVGAIVWVVSIFNVIFFGLTFIQWAASVVAIAIFALIGGGISLLFKRKTLVEISSNAGDDKFYEEVARELQEKPMSPGLWTKAFAETGGDDAKARALYIKYRVAQLSEASQQQLEEAQLSKQRQEKQKRAATNAAKEQQIAAIESAKRQARTGTHRFIYKFLAGFCGLVTISFIFFGLGAPFVQDNSFGEKIYNTIFSFFIAVCFGLATSYCFKETQ